MSYNPEYDTAILGRRFSRDKHGKRMAPLSQLNTRTGRILAGAAPSAHAHLMQDIRNPAPQKRSKGSFGRPSKTSWPDLSHMSQQMGTPPVPKEETNVTQQSTRTHSCRLVRNQSDRAPLDSRGSRSSSPDAREYTLDDLFIIQLLRLSRLATGKDLRRTTTVRRSNTNQPRASSTSRKIPALIANTHAARTIENDRSDTALHATHMKRRFSFDYGPEVLSLGSTWRDEKTHRDRVPKNVSNSFD